MNNEQKLENFCDKLDSLGYSCVSKNDEAIYLHSLFIKIREIMHRNGTKEQRLVLISKLLNEITDETDAR